MYSRVRTWCHTPQPPSSSHVNKPLPQTQEAAVGMWRGNSLTLHTWPLAPPFPGPPTWTPHSVNTLHHGPLGCPCLRPKHPHCHGTWLALAGVSSRRDWVPPDKSALSLAISLASGPLRPPAPRALKLNVTHFSVCLHRQRRLWAWLPTLRCQTHRQVSSVDINGRFSDLNLEDPLVTLNMADHGFF